MTLKRFERAKLTAEQKEEIDDIALEFADLIVANELKAKLNSEQMTAQDNARTEAIAAGKQGNDLVNAIAKALVLTRDQQAAQAEVEKLKTQFATKTFELLTPEQRQKLRDPDYELALKLFVGDGEPMNQIKAHQLFRRAADRGHTLAKTFVGIRYIHGNYGIQRDFRQALFWFNSAMPELRFLAESGDPVAQMQYGLLLQFGLVISFEDPETLIDKPAAMRWYRKSAEQGYPEALVLVGSLYSSGEGVAKDDAQAVKWYRLAAEKNNASGQFNLGLAYANGQGVVKDEVEAVKWYRKAADQGHAYAQHNLGVSYATGSGVEQDDIEALKWFNKSAEKSHSYAQRSLGAVYALGRGVEQDHAEALKWYALAAEQGNAPAQYRLALIYYNGIGVAKNELEAFKWCRKSAEQDYASAQHSLGFMYDEGIGVDKNAVEAVKWYRLAAEQGDANAQNNLGHMYAAGTGVIEDDAEAVKWFRLAAEQGHAKAQKSLGYLYAKGIGVEKNEVEAVKWYRKASNSADPSIANAAKNALRKMGYSE